MVSVTVTSSLTTSGELFFTFDSFIARASKVVFSSGWDAKGMLTRSAASSQLSPTFRMFTKSRTCYSWSFHIENVFQALLQNDIAEGTAVARTFLATDKLKIQRYDLSLLCEAILTERLGQRGAVMFDYVPQLLSMIDSLIRSHERFLLILPKIIWSTNNAQ